MQWGNEKKRAATSAIAKMESAMGRVATARNELVDSQRNQRSIPELREAYERLNAAYRGAISASSAAGRVRGVAMADQIRELTIDMQELWFTFDAGSGVHLMNTAHPASRAAYGPDIPGMDYDPTPPRELVETTGAQQS